MLLVVPSSSIFFIYRLAAGKMNSLFGIILFAVLLLEANARGFYGSRIPGSRGFEPQYGRSRPAPTPSTNRRFCRYGISRWECCPGWTREPSGDCVPTCRNECVNGECVAPDRCNCFDGWMGSTCEKDFNECALRPCQHRCMNQPGSYRCYCESGYALMPDNHRCQRDRRCLTQHCSFACKRKGRKVSCACPPGWKLAPDGKNCRDIDECKTGEARCGPNLRCHNNMGDYICLCPEGQHYEYTRPHKKYMCVDDKTCADEPCFPGVICSPMVKFNVDPRFPISDEADLRLYRCGSCPIGYEGDGETCTPIPTTAGPVLLEIHTTKRFEQGLRENTIGVIRVPATTSENNTCTNSTREVTDDAISNAQSAKFSSDHTLPITNETLSLTSRITSTRVPTTTPRKKTTTAEPTTTRALTTSIPTTTRIPTTTAKPTTTRIPTTTVIPTTTRIPTTTEEPTTPTKSTTTTIKTTTTPPTTTAEPTTTRTPTTTVTPTTTRISTTTAEPTTTTTPTTTVIPTTTTTTTTTTIPTTTVTPTTTTVPTTTPIVLTTTLAPSTVIFTTTTTPPTTSAEPTTTEAPTTTIKSTTTMVPTTSETPTTTMVPTTTVKPTTTMVPTTTVKPTTTTVATTTVAPTTTIATTTEAPTTTAEPTTTVIPTTTTLPTTTTTEKPITTTVPTTTAEPTTTEIMTTTVVVTTKTAPTTTIIDTTTAPTTTAKPTTTMLPSTTLKVTTVIPTTTTVPTTTVIPTTTTKPTTTVIPTTTTIPTTTILTTTTVPTTTTIPTTTPLITTTESPPPQELIVFVSDGEGHPIEGATAILYRIDSRSNSEIEFEASTDEDGLARMPVPEGEQFITYVSRRGFTAVSKAFSWVPDTYNMLPVKLRSDDERASESFSWFSGFTKIKPFTSLDGKYILEIPPGALDAQETDMVTLLCLPVNVSNPESLRRAPQLVANSLPPKKNKRNVTHGLEVFAMAEFSGLVGETVLDILRPVTITIPITGPTEDLRNYQKMTAWYFDETSGVWREDGKGTIYLRDGAWQWEHQTKRLAWWAAGKKFMETSCTLVRTCYDENCNLPAPFMPVTLTGNDFKYSSQKLTDEKGKACFNFKLGGRVQLASPCNYVANEVDVKGSKKAPNCCHNSYGTQLVKHHGKSKKKGNKCEKVVVLIAANFTAHKCPDPSLELPKHVSARYDSLNIGSVVKYSCKKAKRIIVGPERQSCRECGVWRKDPPQCLTEKAHKKLMAVLQSGQIPTGGRL